MTARSHVPDKELQGYMTKWERDLEFYAKATGSEAVTPAQHKMFLLRMCSAGLHTHLGYTKATEGTLATIRQEIANWLHRTQPQGKGGGFAALEEAQVADDEDGDYDVGPEATERLLEEDPSGALLAVVKKGLRTTRAAPKGVEKGATRAEKAAARAKRAAARRVVPELVSNAELKTILLMRALFALSESRLEDQSGCRKTTR